MQMEKPQSPLRLNIDQAALAGNWRALDRLSGSARAGAAVKADAYGLGARSVVPILRGAGCQDFFVAHWVEAAEIVDLLDPKTLAVLHGPLTTHDAVFAVQTGVRPVINSLYQARLWLDAGGGLCDLMVDTGMSRLGIDLKELSDPLIQSLEIDTLLSHLVAAEDDTPLNEQQKALWLDARQAVRHQRGSLANSAGIALGAGYHGDLTRPGLALYGGVPCSALASTIQQVARPTAAILQVRELEVGQTVGYNHLFTAARSMRVGAVALGYADGFLRCWTGQGACLWQGKRLPVLGRVSMDMVVIDLDEAPELAEGDYVEVAYALPEASVRSGLSQYELLTLLGQRFER